MVQPDRDCVTKKSTRITVILELKDQLKDIILEDHILFVLDSCCIFFNWLLSG